jgi:hypothetical protein
MAFKTGISGNPNGRPTGSKNKITLEIKETLKEIIESEISNIPSRLESLSDKDRLEFITKLLPYVISKKSNDTIIKIKAKNLPEWFG